MPRAPDWARRGKPLGVLALTDFFRQNFTAVHTRKVDGCYFLKSRLPRATYQHSGADFQLFAQPCQHHGADASARRDLARLRSRQ